MWCTLDTRSWFGVSPDEDAVGVSQHGSLGFVAGVVSASLLMGETALAAVHILFWRDVHPTMTASELCAH